MSSITAPPRLSRGRRFCPSSPLSHAPHPGQGLRDPNCGTVRRTTRSGRSLNGAMRLLAAVPSASLPLDHYALFAARRSPATMSSPSSVIDSAASSSTILRPPHCPDGPFSGQCAAPTSTRFSVQRPDSCAATPQCSGLTLRKLHHPDPPTCTDHLPLPSNRWLTA